MSASTTTDSLSGIDDFRQSGERQVLPLHPASDYLSALFVPNDLIAVMLLRDRETPTHWFALAGEAASSKYLERLQKKNDVGYNVYVCMNPLSDKRRVKENVAAIRTLYLDQDVNGLESLEKISKSVLVPKPHFILETSPGKFQTVWCVDGIQPVEQEGLLRALIQEFGGDPAASDMTRVLRLPGFANRKYPSKPVVQIVENSFDGGSYAREDFKVKTAEGNESRTPFVAPSEIYEGRGRNDQLFRTASSLRTKNLTDEAVRAAVAAQNRATCKPPLDDEELNALLASALRNEYKARDAKWRQEKQESVPNKPAKGVYSVPPTEAPQQKRNKKKLQFQSVARPDPDGEYVIQPVEGQQDGWFPLGDISLVGGASGTGKTTLLFDMLTRQKAGYPFLGHETNKLLFHVLTYDRGKNAFNRTMRRLRLNDLDFPMTPLESDDDKSTVQIIADEIEKLSPTPRIVVIEGLDMLIDEANRKSTVTSFMRQLQKIAAHFHSALIGTVGAPKTKRGEEYATKRDHLSGSEAWGRNSETVAILEFSEDDDGTAPRRELSVLPRNAKAEKFSLQFQGGRLVQVEPTEQTEKHAGGRPSEKMEAAVHFLVRELQKHHQGIDGKILIRRGHNEENISRTTMFDAAKKLHVSKVDGIWKIEPISAISNSFENVEVEHEMELGI